MENQEAAQEMYDRLVKQAQETEGVTEGLKEENPMLWVQKMNTITAGAQEMVLNEIIYS